MSQENVEVVRRSFRRLAQSREPNVEWRSLTDEPDSAVYCGYDGVRRLFDEWVDNFEELRTEPEEFIEVGEYVVVPARLRGLGRASGVEVELPDTFVIRLSKGKLIEVREYSDTGQALEAVGLSE